MAQITYLYIRAKSNTFGTNFVYSLVSKNRIVPIIQQVHRQSLPMGLFVDFRDSSLTFSSGERDNEYPVHTPEVTQTCNSTIICFFFHMSNILYLPGNSKVSLPYFVGKIPATSTNISS